MLDVKLLGEKIRELRKEKGYSQNEFANMLDVSYQAVSNWERGVSPPELDNLIRISELFGVLTDELLKPSGRMLILGIDGGGTKTEFITATPDGTVVERILKDGCNPNAVGMQKALDIISGGISEMLLKYHSIACVYMGIAGVTSGENQRYMSEYFKEKYPTIKIEVKNDASLLFAVDDSADMAIISGTGAVAFVKNKNEYTRLGGWGYIFDSSGSAYDIGRAAVSLALSEEDFKLKPSLLSRMLKNKLGTDTLWDAIPTLYKGSTAFIASLSAVVFDAYKQGDEKAIEIIDKNAARLAELLNYGKKLYGVNARAVAGGGVFEHYGDIIKPHIKKYTDIQIKISTLPPVYGACRMSSRMISGADGENFYNNFNESYRRITK